MLSSHGLVLKTFLQPVAGRQESLVQGLPSKQYLGVPEMQVPTAHWSFTLQALPSSQAKALGSLAQPDTGEQESVVQTLSSSHFTIAAPTHMLAWQASPVVQALASSHRAALGV
jgi:hypothetical protein